MMITKNQAARQIERMGFHPLAEETGWAPGAVVTVSGEHGDGAMEYYELWINPKLETWAKDHGLYWEWINAVVIAAYEG